MNKSANPAVRWKREAGERHDAFPLTRFLAMPAGCYDGTGVRYVLLLAALALLLR